MSSFKQLGRLARLRLHCLYEPGNGPWYVFRHLDAAGRTAGRDHLRAHYYPDERDDATEHLDFAISEFRDMKMQPSLEKAEALQERAN